MAYYDSFTRKPRNPRDDWRDDAKTHRPARDGMPDNRPPRDDRPPRRDDRAPRYDNRPPRDGAPRYDNRPPRDDRPPRYDNRPPRDDRPPRYDNRPQRDDRPPHYDNRPPRDDRPPRYDNRPQRDDRTPRYDNRPQRDDRAPRNDRPPRVDDRAPQDADARMQDTPDMPRENLLIGRNPIREALRAGRDLEKLLVARGELIGSAREIVAMAREQHVVVQEVDRARLDAIAPHHQGLIAIASAYAYQTVDAMLALAKERGEAPLLVVLDGVTDPHNLGAIIRSAECAGAHGVILPERRAVGLTPAAVKASAGAVEYLPVAREVNIARTLEQLKQQGMWIYGAAMEGEDYRKVDFSGPAVLVIGSEGEGLSRLVKERCDRTVSLPMRGHIDSLNASVAAGVLLYAIAGARG